MEYDNNHFIIASRAYSLQEPHLVPARARPEPACLPFSSLRVTLAVARVNLQTTGLSHFFVNARFQFRCSFAGYVTAPTDRTVYEGLEPARF
jgi:hypothetical protein